MILEDLKKLIHSDLTLVLGKNKFEHVCCYDTIFNIYKNFEVIGIRSYNDSVIVSIK